MLDQWIARNLLVLLVFLFLAYVFFREEHDICLNWGLFFSSLWVCTFLLLVNKISVYFEFWSFNPDEDLSVFIPYDLYFTWIVFWGILLPFVLKGRFILISALCLFWLDILLMPLLERYNILQLNAYWLIGELLLILVVFIPSQIWFHLFFENKGLKWRSLFQFLTLSIIYCMGIPFAVYLYFPTDIRFNVWDWSTPYILQLAFILLLPALIAIIDLGKKGKGTPFPYDATTKLVQSGVYAYIRNPIQWSLTFLFIPLALFFHSYILLAGIVVSLAYTIGISEPHEKTQLEGLFSVQWVNYKKNVPLWYFLWKPLHIPKAKIYFKKDCQQCSETRRWFERNKPSNLIFMHAEDFKGQILKQVTYIDSNGQVEISAKAIAHALEHINLAYAALGWFIRLPLISHLVQLIFDSMGLFDTQETCELL